MLDVTTTTTIDRPVDEVAAWAGDPSHAPQWYANTSSVEWETPPPVTVGSRLRFVAGFLGTTMVLRDRGEPTGFSRAVAPLMASAVRRANVQDLARLKALLEQGTP